MLVSDSQLGQINKVIIQVLGFQVQTTWRQPYLNQDLCHFVGEGKYKDGRDS